MILAVPLQGLVVIMAVVITLLFGCCIMICMFCAYIHIYGQKAVAEAQDSGKLGTVIIC